MPLVAVRYTFPIRWITTLTLLLFVPQFSSADEGFDATTAEEERSSEASVEDLRGENHRGVIAVEGLTKWFAAHPTASLIVNFGTAAVGTQVVHMPTNRPVQGVMLTSREGVVYYPLDSAFFDPPMMTTHDVCLQAICGVLSALFSVTQILDVVDPSDVTNPDGTYKKDVLEKARSAAPAPWSDCGTTSRDNCDIHRALGGKRVRCDGDDTKFDPANPDASCRKLSNRVAAGEDCTAQVITAAGLSHFMPIANAQPIGGGVCAVTTRDTTNQGDGRGNGVPSDPPTMRWSVRPNMAGTGVSTFVASGPNAYLWNGPGGLARNANEFYYICCRLAPAASDS